MMGRRHGKSEDFTIEQSCPAVEVPWGTTVTLREGRPGTVTQRLGGTITVLVDGNLYRVDEEYHAALGLEPVILPEIAAMGSDGGPITAEKVEAAAWEILRSCFDPEIPLNIVDLGLVYSCVTSEIDHGSFRVDVTMTVTAPGCGMGTLMCDEAREKLLKIPCVDQAKVELVFDPPWTRAMMSEAAQLEMGMF